MKADVRACLERALELLFPDDPARAPATGASRRLRPQLATEFGLDTVRDTLDHLRDLLDALEP